MVHHNCGRGDPFPINTFTGCLAHLSLLEGGGERRGRQKELQSLKPLVLALPFPGCFPDTLPDLQGVQAELNPLWSIRGG